MLELGPFCNEIFHIIKNTSCKLKLYRFVFILNFSVFILLCLHKSKKISHKCMDTVLQILFSLKRTNIEVYHF